MNRSDITFTITVNPVTYVYACQERRALEERGLFGFHDSPRCPNCRLIDRGYEFWGENGHCQGSANDRAGMIWWIASKAKQQWRTKQQRIMGYRFVKGGVLRYCGGYILDQPPEGQGGA